MNDEKLKVWTYIYFSALHISEKIAKKDVKFKTISFLTNMIFIFCLGFGIIIFGLLEGVYDVTVNVNDNIIGFFIGLVFLAFLINQAISKLYKKYVNLPLAELLVLKNTINKGVLNWLFPVMAIVSIIVLSISIIIGDLIRL